MNNMHEIYFAGGCFWGVEAEDYHQDYLAKNPFGYCHISFESLSLIRTKDQPI